MSKKINQFSTRAKYVSPSSKTVEVNVFESVLSGSYGEAGQAGSAFTDGNIITYSDEF